MIKINYSSLLLFAIFVGFVAYCKFALSSRSSGLIRFRAQAFNIDRRSSDLCKSFACVFVFETQLAM